MKDKQIRLEEKVMLDGIYYALRDMMPLDIVSYFKDNPHCATLVIGSIDRATGSDYHPARLGFLRAVKDVYLQPRTSP